FISTDLHGGPFLHSKPAAPPLLNKPDLDKSSSRLCLPQAIRKLYGIHARVILFKIRIMVIA
ncbi:hypothetical protein, partial [Erwinia persicina]|uniref:hypothetical protein n=1 Tax=Erwinia persicina TaxID=55211 RepID=UPI001C3F29F4